MANLTRAQMLGRLTRFLNRIFQGKIRSEKIFIELNGFKYQVSNFYISNTWEYLEEGLEVFMEKNYWTEARKERVRRGGYAIKAYKKHFPDNYYQEIETFADDTLDEIFNGNDDIDEFEIKTMKIIY